ncbi:unnamed protein product, partial [Prunus brigantina]
IYICIWWVSRIHAILVMRAALSWVILCFVVCSTLFLLHTHIYIHLGLAESSSRFTVTHMNHIQTLTVKLINSTSFTKQGPTTTFFSLSI